MPKSFSRASNGVFIRPWNRLVLFPFNFHRSIHRLVTPRNLWQHQCHDTHVLVLNFGTGDRILVEKQEDKQRKSKATSIHFNRPKSFFNFKFWNDLLKCALKTLKLAPEKLYFAAGSVYSVLHWQWEAYKHDPLSDFWWRSEVKK